MPYGSLAFQILFQRCFWIAPVSFFPKLYLSLSLPLSRPAKHSNSIRKQQHLKNSKPLDLQSNPIVRTAKAMDESEEHSNGNGGGGGHQHGYEWKLPAALSANTTSVHVTALDGVVNVNSLFTVAVFVGLSLATPGELRSLAGDPSCDAGPDTARSLLVFEVVAFSSFLFSSLVAQGLKLALNLINSKDPHDTLHAHIDARVLRLGMLASAVGSVVGCVFLMVSMVMVVQIRLGTLGCATNRAAAKAAAGLVGLVSTALAVYVGTVFYTFTH